MAPQRPQPKLAPAKIDRSAFLYLPPDGRGDDNAKCKACILYLAGNRCIIHAPDVVTRGEDSCCFYIPGRPAIRGRPVGLVTPEESGLVKRQVRCENCFYVEKGKCNLFDQLNKTLPAVFNLDVKIDKHGCCNAQTKK